MNFFGAAIGRSGTVWLWKTLDHSPTHKVKHEGAESIPSVNTPIDQWGPFPVERWEGGNYGEVHGYLRRYLSPDYAGLERTIPRRFVLLRHPKAIIRSWMNRGGNTIADFPWVAKEILRDFRKLSDYSQFDEGARCIRMEDVTTDLSSLQNLIDWLRLDFTATPEMQSPQNGNKTEWFDWTPELDAEYDRLSKDFTQVIERHYP